jgi:hypothetical protein
MTPARARAAPEGDPVMLHAVEQREPCLRSITPVQWNREGRHNIVVRACGDVPTYDDGMIRRALLRASLLAEDVAALKHAIACEIFELGYSARMRADTPDGFLVVEVSRSR